MGIKIRVGIYRSHQAFVQSRPFLERLKKRSSGAEIEIVELSVGRKAYMDEYEQVVNALAQEQADICLIDGTKLQRAMRTCAETEKVRIIGPAPRSNPANVLVVQKRLGKNIAHPWITTNDAAYEIQMEHISEDVHCQYIPSGVKNQIRSVKELAYVGAVLPAALVKGSGFHRERGLAYRYYDCESFVPLPAQGMVVAVTGQCLDRTEQERQQIYDILQHAVHTETLEEYAIEQAVIHKVHEKIYKKLLQLSNITLNMDDLCVNAAINRNKLTISIFFTTDHEDAIKMTVKGMLEEKNRIILQLITKIQQKLIY